MKDKTQCQCLCANSRWWQLLLLIVFFLLQVYSFKSIVVNVFWKPAVIQKDKDHCLHLHSTSM